MQVVTRNYQFCYYGLI